MPRQVTNADRVFGAQVKELRLQRGLSLRRLGKLCHCSHGFLWDLEAGTKRPSAAVAALLDAALGTDGRLSAMVGKLSADSGERLAAIDSDGPLSISGPDLADVWQGGVDAAAELWRADMLTRGPRQDVRFSATAFLPSAMRWLVSPLDERPVGHGERLVGEPDAVRLRELTAAYRCVDNRFGGGYVRDSVVRFLDGEVAPLLAGRFDVATGRLLLSAAAEATQLAAWASYDVGLHGVAQRYMVQALRLAAGAGDRALGAEILAAMSHQAAYLGASMEAVDLARAAGQAANRAGVAAIEAESAVLEAQGFAVGGDERSCATALDRAERALDTADRTSDPQWIAYFDEAYLSAKFGHCFAALGRGDLARRFAERSLTIDGKQYARGRQFNLTLLGVAHCQAGEPEEAGRIGIQAVEAAGDLDSARARDYLRDLSNRLAKHVGLPVVADFMSKVRPTLKAASS
jgi:transcriptional regulator with XRE-family HTH domain